MTESHGSPSEGATCLCCWDDIISSNFVEYRAISEGQWLPSGFCEMCIDQLIKTQWETYVKAIEKTTCKAEMRRLLQRGPPINVRDIKALPCPDDGEVFSLWYSSDSNEHSAKLDGSLTGDERDTFLKEKINFFAENEPEEEAVNTTKK